MFQIYFAVTPINRDVLVRMSHLGEFTDKILLFNGLVLSLFW